MARGRRKDAWDRTAALLAKIHNVNCMNEESLLRPLDCHPFYDEEDLAEMEAAHKPHREKGSIGALATLIVGTPPPETVLSHATENGSKVFRDRYPVNPEP